MGRRFESGLRHHPPFLRTNAGALASEPLEVGIVLSILIALAQDISVNRTLVCGDKPYLFTPPEYVASIESPQMRWSPDGRILIIVGRESVERPAAVLKVLKGEPVPQSRLVLLWSKDTGRTREILRLAPNDEVDIAFAGVNSAPYLLTHSTNGEVRTGVVWRIVEESRAVRIFGPKPDIVGLTGSPTKNFCVFFDFEGGDNGATPYLLFGDRVEVMATLPAKHYPMSEWDVTGTKLRVATPRQGQTQRVSYLDVPAQSIGDVIGWKHWEQPGPHYELGLGPFLQASTFDSERKLKRCQISQTNASSFEGSETGASIAFYSEGAVFAVSVEPIDKVAYEQMLARAEQNDAMMEAKQTMLAVLMLAADNDDRVGAATEVGSQLGPYLKNASIMSRFTFAYEGTLDFSKIENPAEFVVGHIQTSRGRAVAYADGHVKWVRKG